MFLAGSIISGSFLVSPPAALLAGLIYGLCFSSRFPLRAKRLTVILLQASVVALGFGMNLHEVVHAGSRGFLYTATSIVMTLLLGLGLGRLLRVEGIVTILISVGTAICGGSAIAAVGPVLNASEEEMAVSLGTVFVLNSIALLVFPAIGWRLHLGQPQFGLWCALAIHDTSSVVGAAAKFGSEALTVGATVKLARALWIVPVTLVFAMLKRSKTAIKWPWFILFFCAATGVNTYVPALSQICRWLYAAGKIGLTVTLFLIGASISRPMLKKIGVLPLFVGSVLWITVALVTLALIRAGVISI